jgi:hypothetical protein
LNSAKAPLHFPSVAFASPQPAVGGVDSTSPRVSRKAKKMQRQPLSILDFASESFRKFATLHLCQQILFSPSRLENRRSDRTCANWQRRADLSLTASCLSC